MWFLYTLFTVAVLMLSTEAQTEKIFGKIPFGGLIPGFGIAVLAGLAAYLRQWFIERKKNKVRVDTSLSGNIAQSSAKHRAAWEIVIVVVLMAVGMVLRFDRMLDGQGELSAYYETAIVMEGQIIPSVVHGADYLYLQVLHLFFVFVGNKFAAAVWFQIFLQFLAALVLYAGVRRLAGPAAALVMFGFFMSAKAMIDGAVILSPQMLYLLLFAIGIDFLTVFQKIRLNYLAFLGAGIWIGLMGYLDIGGFLLLILLAACASEYRNVKTGRRIKLTAFRFGLIGTLAGFLGAIGADASISGKAFGNVLGAWLGLYFPGHFQSSVLLKDMNTGWWTVVLSIFMIAGVFSFWYDKERDRMSMWVLGGCVSILAGCFGMFTAELPMYLYLSLFLVVLAGLGVGKMYDEPMKNESEGIKVEVTEKTKMAKKEKKVEPAEIPASEEVPETALPMEVPVEEPKSPKYIENPLPLPKPHVKRVMDYTRKPSPGQDDFDHPVNDNDDFDI